MHRIRGKLTYSNVVATVCLFLLIGGGSAYAASQLGRESVGTAQLKKAAVTPAKLSSAAKSAMTGPQGPQGQQGPKGATGAKGAKGAQGARGEVGPKGDAGAKGDKGDPGEPGNANVLVYNLGAHDFATTATMQASLFGSLAEWEEGSYQVQLITSTTSIAVPGPGEGSVNNYSVRLEEATPGNLKVIVTRVAGAGETFTNVRITRTFGELVFG